MIVMDWLLAVWAMKTFRGIAIPEFIGVFGIITALRAPPTLKQNSD
ncbi:hypothetical protein [Thermococcus sp. CX2]|nr:hypothetical protein [Thermococcus sp. CX2]